MIAMAILWLELVYCLVFGVNVLIFAIGAFLFAIARAKCTKEILTTINRSTKHKSNRKYIVDQLIESIDFNSKSNPLSSNVKNSSFFHITKIIDSLFSQFFLPTSLLDEFSDIFEPIITTLFIFNLVTICSALLIIQIEIVKFA